VSIVFDFATGTRSGQEPSYVRKNSQMASFAKHNMEKLCEKKKQHCSSMMPLLRLLEEIH
jgi:hypothetical protein